MRRIDGVHILADRTAVIFTHSESERDGEICSKWKSRS